MRTATQYLLFAMLPLVAAPLPASSQDSAKPRQETSPVQQKAREAQAPTARFEATPASVTPGQAAQLTWTVEGATSVTIEPVVGSVPATGSAPVTPAETTIYTLTAVVPSGNISATAKVTVGVAATTPQTGDAEVKTPATVAPASSPSPAPPDAPAPATSSMPAPSTAPTTEGNPKLPAAPPAANIDPAMLAAPRDTTKKPSLVDEHAFVLGAEDQIAVTVYGSPEFTGQHMIRPDGKITLNFIGEVMAADVTPEELGNAIKEKIKKYVVEPDVSVSVLAVKSKRFFIQGEVNKTGEFTLVRATHVLEALVNAGGFRDFANKKNIIVLRGTERIKFNYNEVIKGKHMEQNILLKPDDIILVR